MYLFLYSLLSVANLGINFILHQSNWYIVEQLGRLLSLSDWSKSNTRWQKKYQQPENVKAIEDTIQNYCTLKNFYIWRFKNEVLLR